MSTEHITPEFEGEKLALIEPALRRYVDDGATRLRFFSGRHLTKENLGAEQDAHIARLAARVCALTDGIVDGLDARLDFTGSAPLLRIAPGRGLTASGEDVVLRSAHVVPFPDLRVLSSATGFGEQLKGVVTPERFSGVIVLKPCRIRVSQAAKIHSRYCTQLEPTEFGNAEDDNAYHRERWFDSFAVGLLALPAALQVVASDPDRWRNIQSAKILRREIARDVMPWLRHGIAIALVGMEKNRPIWLDRHAVARAGGTPRPRVTMRERGEPRVWTARILQGSEHLAELATADALVKLRHLAPAGFLPAGVTTLAKGATRWDVEQNFFPAHWAVDVVVVPAEQLDTVLAGARALDGYDLDCAGADRVRLLLAVSQRFFDAQLLEIEPPPVNLTRAVAEMEARLLEWRSHSSELHAKGDALEFAAEGTHPAAEEKPALFDSAAPRDDAFGTTPAGAQAFASAALTAFKDYATKKFDSWRWNAGDGVGGLHTPLERLVARQNAVTADETGSLNALGTTDGLEQFAKYLEGRITTAQETLDINHLRARISVRRLSDVIANNSLATQFALSDSLSSVMKTAQPTLDATRVNDFAGRLFSSLGQSAVATGSGTPEEGGAVKFAKKSTKSAGGIAGLAAVDLGHFDNANTAILEAIGTVGADTPIGKQLSDIQKNLGDASSFVRDTIGRTDTLKEVIGLIGGGSRQLGTEQIRILDIDRLKPPLPAETRENVGAEKDAIFDQLDEFDLALGGINVTDFIADKDVEGKAFPPAAGTKFPVRKRLSFGALLSYRKTILPVLDSTQQDHEARHFAAGVEHGDMALAALRAVGRRLDEYRSLLVKCREAQATVRGQLSELNKRAAFVTGEVEEAAQDLSVAKALLDEELARIKRINDRREAVLRKHLARVLYTRPRVADATMAVPSHVLEPALPRPPVVACLEDEALEIPPELDELRTAFRSAPARWFTHVPRWLRFLGRPDPLREMLLRIHALPVANPRPSFFPSTMPMPVALRPAFELSAAIIGRYQFPAIRVAALSAFTFTDLAAHARETLTLGNLLDHAPAKIAESASRELADILKVAACLHRAFGEAPVAARLEWVERFSQFDGPADFRAIERLPQWNTLGYTLRQRLVAETTWLFERMDGNGDAVELINSLVRMALLLSAHAPVNKLIVGNVAEPVRPAAGGRVRLAVDVAHVRIGMEVIVRNGAGDVMKGIVEDIGAGVASAKILTAPGNLVQFDSSARAEFRGGPAR